ncbi:MAG TPA: FHA domain-containing protein [Gemmatimonadales bacterium]|nr:FHA domain-containing protein [Gemmatimonadales bacterium]
MTACPYCGRANDPGAQFCMDCGKPMGKSTGRAAAATSAAGGGEGGAVTAAGAAPTRVVARSARARDQGEPISCPFCGGRASALQPFCPHCGRRLTAPGSGPNCPRCASPVEPGIKFCATCGAPLADLAAARRGLSGPSRAGATIALVLLDDLGNPVQRFERHAPDTTIGRQDGDIRFPEDVFLSPLHAKLSWEQDTLVVRDLGSRNGTWVFLEEAHRLLDGDLLLIGSQVIRFRRLGYPGPHPPDADATKRMGSLSPSADIASLTQLRSDGSVRDVIQLSPGRDVVIGREQGEWVFPYDPSMSARHALVRSEDADFVVVDANSRNGIALAARGDIALRDQSRILVGDKLLRIEIPT